MFGKFKSFLRQKVASQGAYAAGVPSQGILQYGLRSIMNAYRSGTYDNTYPNISIIANQFMTVLPFAVDENGDRVKNTPAAVAALYSPNLQMSGPKFFEALAVMCSVHSEVYIAVWHEENGVLVCHGHPREEQIVGYTFIEEVTRIPRGDHYELQTADDTFQEDEVIAISYGINPYSIISGYSPSFAIKKWANIDDYIADYQSGVFLNGAVPAGMFIITAKSTEDFNETVDHMIKKHQGRGKNNNVVYVHRPISELSGVNPPAQIEWVPFSTSNKDLTLDKIFEQANKKLDAAFGVPKEIKGEITNSTYASARVAEAYFAKFVMQPILLKVWTQFTHGLNRVTGGLGYAISYEYEIPQSADEEKVKAETAKLWLDTLLEATTAGATVEQAVNGLGLPEDLKNMTIAGATEANDNQLVVKAAEDKSITPTKSKAYSDEDIEADPELKRVIEEHMAQMVEDAVTGRNRSDKEKEQEHDRFVEAMLIILLARMVILGGAQQSAGRTMLIRAGVEVPQGMVYSVTPAIRNSYGEYLNNVAFSFDEATDQAIKRVLEKSEILGWTKTQTGDELMKIIPDDLWRVDRLANSEYHRAAGLAALDSMAQLSEETGVKFSKTWHRDPASNSCANCIALDGMTTMLDESFVVQGGQMPNGQFSNFAAIESADAHPNCHCYLSFDIVQTEAKSVDVKCPKCKRFLFKSAGGEAKSIKCQSCKKTFDVTVSAGKAKIIEIEPLKKKGTVC